MRVEIGVESVAGARVAAAAGAARVELCAGLSDGGLTPSAALIEAASALVEVHVLVRPRPGDFRYDRDELAVIVRDIAVAREHGATGVVVGALTDDGRVDDACAAFVAAAAGMQTTFHRAIDVSADSRQALDDVVSLGFTRVLTSGRRRSALDGAPVIKDLVAQAAGRIEVMAGGGVRAANAARVVAATGVDDVHAAPRRPVGHAAGGEVSYAGAGVPAGHDHFETDPDEVTALCKTWPTDSAKNR
ncbi:copper homeostasis protein CutC [Actinophytocola glycyrrhizae]|uniref:PF03932 family protein CutC n=1 Tax=Actinophytocola glycyrrhizae TaxID=2044873 RepID=A0ABV9S902_9PSEU